MSILCWIIFFEVLTTGSVILVGAGSAANQPLTCFEEAVQAVGRACGPRSSTKKRNTPQIPFGSSPVVLEEESDYENIPGLGIGLANENPLEQHTNFPVVQSPAVNPSSPQFNAFGGQQPGVLGWHPQPQVATLGRRQWPSLHPRSRRMYSTGTQLAAKCCGRPSCYVAELAAMSASSYANLCP